MTIKKELETIRKAGGGELQPHAIVAYAKAHKKSALHKKFNWNVSKAAHEYWLWQARQIIRVHVEIIDNGDGELVEMRGYVCPVKPGNPNTHERSYTATRDSVGHAESRNEIILAQLARMDSIHRSYPLAELKPVKDAIDKCRRRAESSLKLIAAE